MRKQIFKKQKIEFPKDTRGSGPERVGNRELNKVQILIERTKPFTLEIKKNTFQNFWKALFKESQYRFVRSTMLLENFIED